MEVKDRFVLFLKAVKTTQRDFAKVAKYRQQSLSKFITGETKSPKIDLFIALAKHYPNLNLRWLLLGQGKMFGNEDSSDKTKIIELMEENTRLKDELLQAKNEIIEMLRTK